MELVNRPPRHVATVMFCSAQVWNVFVCELDSWEGKWRRVICRIRRYALFPWLLFFFRIGLLIPCQQVQHCQLVRRFGIEYNTHKVSKWLIYSSYVLRSVFLWDMERLQHKCFWHSSQSFSIKWPQGDWCHLSKTGIRKLDWHENDWFL